MMYVSIFSVLICFYIATFFLDKPRVVNVILALPFFIIVTPYLFFRLYEVKKVEKKMQVVPRFFRDIVDNVESGVSLVRSIKACVNNEYGPLNSEVVKLNNRIEWGIDVETAFMKFAEDVGSEELKKDILLVIEARRVGGHVEKMLREISEKINADNLRKKEIRNSLASNTVTGYISFVIFIFIVIVSFNNLFANLGNASFSGINGGASVGENLIKIDIFKSLITMLSYEMSVLSGMLFGFMSDNNIITGAPHVVALVAITFFAFFLFL